MTAEELIKSIGGVYTECLIRAQDESRKRIVNNSWDLGTLVKNATWSAYCDAFEEAIHIVESCTQQVLKELAERKKD